LRNPKHRTSGLIAKQDRRRAKVRVSRGSTPLARWHRAGGAGLKQRFFSIRRNRHRRLVTGHDRATQHPTTHGPPAIASHSVPKPSDQRPAPRELPATANDRHQRGMPGKGARKIAESPLIPLFPSLPSPGSSSLQLQLQSRCPRTRNDQTNLPKCHPPAHTSAHPQRQQLQYDPSSLPISNATIHSF